MRQEVEQEAEALAARWRSRKLKLYRDLALGKVRLQRDDAASGSWMAVRLSYLIDGQLALVELDDRGNLAQLQRRHSRKTSILVASITELSGGSAFAAKLVF